MKYAISLFSLLLIVSCATPIEELSTSAVIPEVANINAGENEISLAKEWVTVAPAISDRLLENLASQVTELGIEISKKEEGTANLILNVDATLEAESYRLQVSEERIEITGGSEAGVFYAWQTLRQLLYNHLWSEETWKAVDLSDTAKYAYRGYMLDVSRHFFNAETIKSVIDQISFYKINHLHLHLSDDQGWRIEIKSWPKLTTTGGATEVGGGEGGEGDRGGGALTRLRRRYCRLLARLAQKLPRCTEAMLESATTHEQAVRAVGLIERLHKELGGKRIVADGVEAATNPNAKRSPADLCDLYNGRLEDLKKQASLAAVNSLFLRKIERSLGAVSHFETISGNCGRISLREVIVGDGLVTV